MTEVKKPIQQTRSISPKPVQKAPIPKPTIVTDTIPRGPIVGKNMEYYRNKDNKIVRGVFHHLEVTGGSTTFDYIKYKGDTLKTYKFEDGKIYSIPLGVAKHLNSCGYNEYEALSSEMVKGATAEVPMRVVRKKPRFRFQNLDFLDIDEITDLDGNEKVVLVESI